MSATASAVDTRIYRQPSGLADGNLALATSAPDRVDEQTFFAGFVRTPRVVAGGLLALADIAGADFRPVRSSTAGRDPVVTGDGERLRFEALSTCGGLYGRLDLAAAELDGATVGRGTTNVDINPELYEALTRVGGEDPLRLSVGEDELAVSTLDGKVVEKRVPLPARWLRGLAEVAAHALPMDPRLEIRAGRAVALLAEMSARTGRQARWLVPAGSGWRSTTRPLSGAVCVADGFRLSVLRPLLPLARTVTLYAPPVSGAPAEVSGWVLDFGTARFTLLLSTAVRQGFAGDGQLLADLGSGSAVADADALDALLAVDPVIDRASVAARTGWDAGRATSALAALATAGQVGYDVAEASSFHRPLPYRADLVAALHPRLAAARLLTTTGGVVVSAAGIEVTSGESTYLVHRRGEEYACTCAWWVEHQGRRGPCKHVVAAMIFGQTGEQRG
ncbi:SWIM zinc finger domain-containing protein [Micromonospora sp. PLK6-60]|uniref:SWIM zinc finger family protein n=1 Tax=Micromonospora sp. PLK6-60 TaxID=2873383 RepID=UPI001CA7AA4F|nr:SWIM zinc finger family protein [Micromonospora sp. PLK6-60]MBY8875501.1 SWIM zinc finger domain-containing protein [Micromonospora sp. PLK6-60]